MNWSTYIINQFGSGYCSHNQSIKQMDLHDVIRINQLVRGKIDFVGFEQWFNESSDENRRQLFHLLNEFAHQAGVNNAVFTEAIQAAGISEDDPTVLRIGSLRVEPHLAAIEIAMWIETLPSDSLHQHLRFLVSLFGTAEGRVFQRERPEYCNHWWHRDLLDERVVKDLLQNPYFYVTSMKDDAPIKGEIN